MPASDLLLAAAIGGGLYLLARKLKAPPPPPKPTGSGSDCDALCKSIQQDNDACRAACSAGKSLAEILAGLLYNSTQDKTDEANKRQANNDKLNGAPDVHAFVSGPLLPMTSSVLRYKNGCVPYFDAPGFAKCAPGTLDMYRTAIDRGAGYDGGDWDAGATEADLTTLPAYLSPDSLESAYTAIAKSRDDAAHWYQLNLQGDFGGDQIAEHINKNHMMTGGAGDPATVGPVAFAADKSNATWWVRGQKTQCTKGTAPRAIVGQAFNRDDMTAGLSDDDARTCVDIYSDPSVQHVSGGCPPPPGFTFDPSSNGWRRLRVGETKVNLGPCAATPVNSGLALDVSLSFLPIGA